jgi:beta-phosphoglucomutase
MDSPSHIARIGFLFDLDGVLVDTAKFHFVAWRRLAQSFGADFTEEQNEQLKGVGRAESLERILKWGGIQLSAEQKQAAMLQKNAWYLDLVETLTPADMLPGAADFLREARSLGIGTALGSASKNAELILSKLEIDHMLDAVIDGNMVSHSKPHPEVFLKGAAALNRKATQCVVFEDAVAGVQAARAGGMKCVGIGSKDILGEADIVGASLAVINIQEVIDIL